MNPVEKPVDAVRMMRSIRNRISKEIRGMTFEEQQKYMYARLPAKTVAHFSGSAENPREKAQAPCSSGDLTAGL